MVFINTTLQYIEDWQALVADCLRLQPQYVILTRTLTSATQLLTKQTVHGRSTPCLFISTDELIQVLAEHDYVLVHRELCWEEDLSSLIPKGFANELDPHPVRNFVFVRSVHAV